MFGAHEMLNEEGRYFPYFSGENTEAWTLQSLLDYKVIVLAMGWVVHFTTTEIILTSI